MYEQQVETLKRYPDIKIVSTVYGMATSAVTQSAVSNVLPSLPPISGSSVMAHLASRRRLNSSGERIQARCR